MRKGAPLTWILNDTATPATNTKLRDLKYWWP